MLSTSNLTGCATRRLETAGRNQLGLSWGCRLQLGYRTAQPVEAEQQEVITTMIDTTGGNNGIPRQVM